MLRPRYQYRMLQAAFVFALVGVAFFGSYQGIRHSEKREAHAAADHGGEKKHPTPFTVEWVTADPVAFATFLLVGVTFGLAVFTAFLYRATAQLARDAKESGEAALTASTKATDLATKEFVSTHRPRLRVRKVTVAHLVVGAPIKVQYEIVNVGGTDATWKWATVSVEVLKAPAHNFGPPFNKEEPHLGAGNLAGSGLVIRPGEKILAAFETSLEYAHDARYSAKTMTVRGEVHYGDANKVERQTMFERFYRANSSGPNVHRFGKESTPDPDYEYED